MAKATPIYSLLHLPLERMINKCKGHGARMHNHITSRAQSSKAINWYFRHYYSQETAPTITDIPSHSSTGALARVSGTPASLVKKLSRLVSNITSLPPQNKPEKAGKSYKDRQEKDI
jgi:hypothetical protein